MSTLQTLLNSPEFLRDLNKHDNDQILEEASDLEDIDTIPDLVFDVREDLEGPYERVDGLVAYPDPGTFELHSFHHAHSDRQTNVSEHEAKIRDALRIRQSILLVTSARETDGLSNTAAQFFKEWTPLRPQTLNGRPSLVQLLSEKQQEKWDAVNLEVNVLGNGGSLQGVFGLIRNLITRQDVIDLYMAAPRQIHVRLDTPDESAYRLEKELFGTMKYDEYSTYLTVITYGSADCGAIELYEITQDTHGLATSIAPVVAAKSVPKTILRSLKQPRKIELLRKPNKIRYFCAGKQPAPLLARVETRKPGEPNVEWRGLGQAWRRALRTAENSSYEGLVATIPQMMAFLHLTGSGLHAMASTSVQEFSVPLAYHPSNGPTPFSSSDLGVKRGVKITEGPMGEAHRLDRVKVTVMFPHDCSWAHERLLWF